MKISSEVIKEIARSQRRFLLFFSILSLVAIPLVYAYFPYLPWDSNRNAAIGTLILLALIIFLDRFLFPKRFAFYLEVWEILISVGAIFAFTAASGFIKSPANVVYLVGVIFSFFVIGRKFGFFTVGIIFLLLILETIIPSWSNLREGKFEAMNAQLPFFFFYTVTMSYIVVILLFLSEVLKRIEQKRIQAQEAVKYFQELVKQLRELDREKSQFITLVAHYFRTPLSRLKWAFDAISQETIGPLTAEQKNLIGESNKSNDDLILLLNQILDISQWELRQAVFEKQIDLSQILEDRAAYWKARAKEKKIILTFDSKKGSPIEGNKEGLAYIFDAIFENAVLYSNEGGFITGSIRFAPDGAEVLIADSGIGIPYQEQKLLFTAFFRASNAKALHEVRKGMGLFIAQKIARAHGGNIQITSFEGKGTEVRIFLPYQQKKSLYETEAET